MDPKSQCIDRLKELRAQSNDAQFLAVVDSVILLCEVVRDQDALAQGAADAINLATARVKELQEENLILLNENAGLRMLLRECEG